MAETKTTRKKTTRRSTKKTGPVSLKSFNPRTGEVMREIPANSPAEVLDIVAGARKVAPEWGAIPVEGRVRMLREVRHNIYRLQDRLVDIISKETGKTAFESLSLDVMGSLIMFYSFEKIAARALSTKRFGIFDPPFLPKALFGLDSRVEYRPLGVVGCITPWNYPLWNTFAASMPALFAGNAIVIKPSEVTPGVGEMLKEIFEPLPSAVVNIVQGGGDIGAALVDAQCDKISFIGSPATGRKICEAAAKHLTPVVMELGGADSAIVLDDANIDYVTSGTLFSAFFNAGQTCASLERIYVSDKIADEFRDAFAAKLKQVNEEDQIGSLTFKPQLETVTRHVEDALSKGATLVGGGPDLGKDNSDGSLWFPATALENVTEDMEVLTNESFGPLVTISRFSDDDEAIQRANNEAVNLTASVWSKDVKRAERVGSQLRAGVISINNHGVNAGAAWAPWGGVGESGFGRLNGEWGLREFTVPTHVGRPMMGQLKQPFWYPYDEPSKKTILGVNKLLGSSNTGERVQGFIEALSNMGKSMKNKL
jgi:succinate-semialdehyde dehydrogenase/glutarate-semialdehyde dehydrogenase